MIRIRGAFTALLRAVPCAVAGLLSAGAAATAQPILFRAPLEGAIGRDYFIVNHVDHDTSAGMIRDYLCGDHTYDGHTGTDFVLPSFRRMDSGAWVVAAASGRVFIVVDTAFDRNKRSDPARGFGNYIGIAHAGGIYTYYAHVRKGSAVVQVGDSVSAGTRLALVGSAGNSVDPHVHFEVWTDSVLVDPFTGPCGASQSWWQEQPAYDTTRGLIDHGIFAWNHPLENDITVDTLRERPPDRFTFDRAGADSTVTLWTHVRFARAGDTARTVWYDSNGGVWFAYDFVFARDVRYFYFWTYILTPPPGVWRATHSIAHDHVDTAFRVTDSRAGIDRDSPNGPIAIRFIEANARLVVETPRGIPARLTVDLFALDGRRIASLFDGESVGPTINLDIANREFAHGAYIAMVRWNGRGAAVPLLLHH